VKKERQALPAVVLRVPYRAVRHGRLAQRLNKEARLPEGVEVRRQRAMHTLESHAQAVPLHFVRVAEWVQGTSLGS
jgi:predicted TIM-barrel enzyme